MVRRRQVVDMLTAEKNRLSSAPPSNASFAPSERPSRASRSALRTSTRTSTTLSASHPPGGKRMRFSRACQGVGRVLSRTLLGHVPELGTISKKKMGFSSVWLR